MPSYQVFSRKCPRPNRFGQSFVKNHELTCESEIFEIKYTHESNTVNR
jgi:hypothetical protein